MAKQVQPLEIILGIKGAEKLAALKSSFRDLTKTVKQSDSDIDAARKSINDYVKSANNSEAVIRGQIKAFEGLREQAAMGGEVYRGLSSDITELKAQLNGSTSAIDAQRKSILELASGAEITAKQVRNAIDKLSALRAETRLDSGAFNAFGKDIDALIGRLDQLAAKTEAAARKSRLLSGPLRSSSGELKAQIEAYKQEVVSIQERINAIDALEARERRLKKYIEERAALEEELASKLKTTKQAGFLVSVEAGRRSVISAASAFNDADKSIGSFLTRLRLLDKNFGEIPNTIAGSNQRLRELQEQFSNTTRSGQKYVAVALEIARVQRDATAATQGLGAALIKDLASGVAVRNQKNLREAIGQLQAEMSELNTETTEGSAKYAENARQVNNLQKKLDQIANSYRNVADMARQATASQVDYGAVARKMYLERDQPGYKTPAETRGKQFLERIDAERQVLRQTLALPAAGQTSAPGTGAARSGGAVPRRGTVGPLRRILALPTSLGTIGGRRQPPSGSEVQINDEARRSYISQTVAVRANTEAKEQARKVEMAYRAEIRKASAANNGSIQAHQRLRAAIENYRVTLPENSKRFALMTKRIQELDAQAEKTSRRMSRRRMSSMQITQAAGAAISGGIFGGPEGFLGGVAGGLLGGVGGAFAGAAIGAQVGQLRQALGGVAEYSANLNKLRIALDGVTNSQLEYKTALSAIARASEDFAIPQSVLTNQFTKLQASIAGAGGGVADTEIAFKGITAAVRATGGSLADVDAALTATAQVFSKGKVSAEELRGQIGERLPGAFTLFAEAIGKTPVELDKALQDGKVSLEDFQTFAKQLFERYGETAKIIASGPEGAGDRLQKALEKLKEAIGPILADIGSQFQDLATTGVNALTRIINKTIEALNLGREGRLKTAQALRTSAASEVERITNVLATGGLSEGERRTQQGMLNLAYRRMNLAEADIRQIQIEMQGSMRRGRGIPEDKNRRFGLEERGERGRPPGGGKTDKIAAAEAKAIELGEKLRRKLKDVAFEFKGVGASAEEAIYLKASKAINAAIDQETDLLKQIDELSKVTGNPYENLRKSATEYAGALVVVAEKQRDLALEELSNKRFSEMLKGYGFSGDVDVSGKVFGSMTPQEFPTGVDSILQPNQLRQNIEELRTSLQQLVEPVNQITNAATAIGDAFSQSFVDAISGAKTAKEALADFFQSVGSYFLDMAKQIIAKMITIAILNSVAKLLPGLGSTGSGAFDLGGMGQAFAPGGSMPFPMLANGGPVNANQPYIVGERGPELFVPFQQGSITSNEAMQQASMAQLPFTRNAESISQATQTAQAMQAAGPISVKYESTVINGVEYVTREQAERIGAQSAERGRALTLQTLQNSVKTRSRVGI